MRPPTLFVGNKNYSSWSLRPWLVLRWGGIAFEEAVIPLGGPGYGRAQIPEVRAVSPSGRVPALQLDGLTLWDSMAIAEWAAEQVAPGLLWPEDPKARALARSAAAEMHSGFTAVRRDMSMNIRRRAQADGLAQDTKNDLERIFELWSSMRQRFSAAGPWLAGTRSIADAFFTPVATRFRTYGIPLPGVCSRYSDTLLADSHFQAWERAAQAESWTIAQTDALFPDKS